MNHIETFQFPVNIVDSVPHATYMSLFHQQKSRQKQTSCDITVICTKVSSTALINAFSHIPWPVYSDEANPITSGNALDCHSPEAKGH